MLKISHTHTESHSIGANAENQIKNKSEIESRVERKDTCGTNLQQNKIIVIMYAGWKSMSG